MRITDRTRSRSVRALLSTTCDLAALFANDRQGAGLRGVVDCRLVTIDSGDTGTNDDGRDALAEVGRGAGGVVGDFIDEIDVLFVMAVGVQ
jgi:hypothetical protein